VSLEIAKLLVYGALNGLNAYVKPGSLHRLKPERLFDEVVCNIVSALDAIVSAYEEGEKIRKGQSALTSLELGRFLAKSYRATYRVCNVVHPEYYTPIIISAIALGHSGVESVLSDPGRFKKSLNAIVSINKWSDIKHYIDSLKSVGRDDMSEHLAATGFTQVSLIQGGASFADVFRTLGSKWPGFILVDPQENTLYNMLKKLVDYYRELRNAGDAVVSLYIDLLEEKLGDQYRAQLSEARKMKLMRTPEGARRLYELDVMLKRSNIVLSGLGEQVVNTSALAALEGVR